MSDYKQIDPKVMKNKDHGLLLTRVDSSNTFQKLLINEDDQYFIASHDVKIEMMNGHFTDGIDILICRDDAVEDDPDSKAMFLNIVISDVLGTFVSSWY